MSGTPTVQDFESDFLILEFFGGDTLYVPLDRLNQIQRYSGAESHVPRLDRLGGTSWGAWRVWSWWWVLMWFRSYSFVLIGR